MRCLVRDGIKLLGIFLIGLFYLNRDVAWAEKKVTFSSPQKEIVTTDATKDAKGRYFQKSWETEFSLQTGTRSDNLAWSIAASGNNPNVLSELTWTDVDSHQICLSNHSRFQRHFYFRGSVQYGWINDGTFRDSDYGENNRTEEWSRSISESNNDEVWDLSAGSGYAFSLLNNRLIVAPLLGISYHVQNLRISDGTQVVSADNPFSSSTGDNPPPIGSLPSSLNSSYFAHWVGPWIGCDFHYQPNDRGSRFSPMIFSLSLEFHKADYSGEGNWNLRSDLAHPKSFEHNAEGYGWSIGGQWLVNLMRYWELTFDVRFQNWSTGSGSERKFWNGGGSTATRLNRVNWDSSSFMVGTVCHF